MTRGTNEHNKFDESKEVYSVGTRPDIVINKNDDPRQVMIKLVSEGKISTGEGSRILQERYQLTTTARTIRKWITKKMDGKDICSRGRRMIVPKRVEIALGCVIDSLETHGLWVTREAIIEQLLHTIYEDNDLQAHFFDAKKGLMR